MSNGRHENLMVYIRELLDRKPMIKVIQKSVKSKNIHVKEYYTHFLSFNKAEI